MRCAYVAALLVLVSGVPRIAEAQGTSATRAVTPAARTPIVSVAATVTEMNVADDVPAAAKRFSDELSARLRPLETRLNNDARLRSAGAIAALTAAAVGAVRGQRTLTFVGTEAIRLGFNRQLGVVRARTGFTVTPSLGQHSFSLTFSRTF